MTNTTTGTVGKVIVIGAGPVGLLTALILGQQNIPVDVLEAQAFVNTAPRGLAYGPAATRVLRKAGLLDKIIAAGGFELAEASWKDAKGNILANRVIKSSSHGLLESASIVYPVGELSQFLVREIEALPSVNILWSHKVVNTGQDDSKAWIDVDASQLQKRLEADFIIGCDGGSSAVRHCLFGHNFPGFTWPAELVAVNVRYDMARFNWSDIQWVIDPVDWALICKIDQNGTWRIAYGEKENVPIEEIRKTLPDRLRAILPGDPSPSDYEVLNLSPYRIHQRLVEHMRVGRFLLAGDAAHLNNPMGGLGLTTGIADVGALTECLIGIHHGAASIDILDSYDELRRAAFKNVTDAVSTTNLKRMWQDPDGIAETDPFFIMLREAKTDPAAAEKLMEVRCALGHKRSIDANESYQGELAIGTDMSSLIDIAA